VADGTGALIEKLGADDDGVPLAVLRLHDAAQGDPGAIIPELGRALAQEANIASKRVQLILVIVGMTRAAPADGNCCRAAVSALRRVEGLDSTAALAAGAVVARTRPATLLADPETLDRGVEGGPDRAAREVLSSLFVLTTAVVAELGNDPKGPVATMARWLWWDLAHHDLTALADVTAVWIEHYGVDDHLVDLLVEVATMMPATNDQLLYAIQALEAVGVTLGSMFRLTQACLSAVMVEAAGARYLPVGDERDERPQPSPYVDGLIAAFAMGNKFAVEFARVQLDQAARHPSPALFWDLVETVDGLPAGRRSDEVRWVVGHLWAARWSPEFSV